MNGRCDDCGDAPATREWDVDFDATIELCASCWKARDSYESPEPQPADGYRPTVQEQQQANRELKR